MIGAKQMKRPALLIISLFCGLLTACAAPQTSLQAPNSDSTAIALAQAAGAASKSLEGLEANQQAANPPKIAHPIPAAATYGMQMPISIDWDGPIGPLVSKIAETANYKLRVLGVVPPVPVLISIHAKNTELANILRSAGLQAGKRASIVVYPSSKTVELSYASSNETL